MISPDAAAVVAGAAFAVVLAWLAAAAIFRFFGKHTWLAALVGSLGLAIMALVGLLVLRRVIPDLLTPVLLFLLIAAACVLTLKQPTSMRERIPESLLVSMVVVCTLLFIDGIIRLTGQRLTMVF